MSSTSWSPRTGVATNAQAKSRPDPKHWANVSDEQLAGLDLEIEGPDKLPGIVTEIPPGNVETYMEFTYDLRGMGREEEFVCVHGHHRHLHWCGDAARAKHGSWSVGFALSRFMARTSRIIRLTMMPRSNGAVAVLRVRELREAIALFPIGLPTYPVPNVIDAFELSEPSSNGDFLGFSKCFVPRLDGALMMCRCRNIYVRTPVTSRAAFIRLLNETAAIARSLTGDPQRVAERFGSIRLDIEASSAERNCC